MERIHRPIPDENRILARIVELFSAHFITTLYGREEPPSHCPRPENSSLTYFSESNPADLSRFEPLEVEYTRYWSDFNSDCSIHQAVLDLSQYRNKYPFILWGDYCSISSGSSDQEIQHSAQYWLDCFVLTCPTYRGDKIMNKVYAGRLPSSTPLGDHE